MTRTLGAAAACLSSLNFAGCSPEQPAKAREGSSTPIVSAAPIRPSEAKPATAEDRPALNRQAGSDSLMGRIVVAADQNHPAPTVVSVVDEWLIAGGADDTLLYVFDRSTGRRTATFGRFGAGPGEFRFIGSLQVTQSASSRGGPELRAFDPVLGRLTPLSIGAGGELTVAGALVTGELAGQETVLWVDDSTLVGVGAFIESRFTLYDASGRRLRALGDLPLLGEGVPAVVVQQILQPVAAVSPSGRQIAVGSRYAGRLDIYSLGDGSRVPAAVPDAFSPTIKTRDNGAMPVFITDGSTLFAYISIAVSPTRIYALYSGRTRKEYPGRANFGAQVQVFDWSGDFKRTFVLDRDAIRLVAEGDSALMTITYDPAPAIVRYALPPPL